MKKILFRVAIVLALLYLVICILLYSFQEKMIFFPEKLSQDYTFELEGPADELTYQASDGALLHGLLFKSDSSKGLIFYLHGNGGSVRTFTGLAKNYTALGYDLFVLDYRGYGKSAGTINSEKQLFDDLQIVYNHMKLRYTENTIIVLGYSIGTGLAAHLACSNNPKSLILQAPYFSLTDMMEQNYPFIPVFLLKYKFETGKFIQQCRMPVAIFHGNRDQVIGYEASLKLKKNLKSADKLVILDGHGHGEMSSVPEYMNELGKMLK